MFQFRSEKQRKAVFAKRHYSTFARRHPLATGYGAATVASIGSALLLRKLGSRIVTLGARGTTPRMLAKVNQAAHKLYPHLKGVPTVKNDLIAEMTGGGAFHHPRTMRAASKFSLVQAMARLSGQGKALDETLKTFGSKPAVFIRRGARARALGSSPAIYTHELGHAAYHTGRGSRLKNAVTGMSNSTTKEGTAILASLAAHPLIDRSRLSEKRKRQLHLRTLHPPRTRSLQLGGILLRRFIQQSFHCCLRRYW